jgi:hypothetical protein
LYGEVNIYKRQVNNFVKEKPYGQEYKEFYEKKYGINGKISYNRAKVVTHFKTRYEYYEKSKKFVESIPEDTDLKFVLNDFADLTDDEWKTISTGLITDENF